MKADGMERDLTDVFVGIIEGASDGLAGSSPLDSTERPDGSTTGGRGGVCLEKIFEDRNGSGSPAGEFAAGAVGENVARVSESLGELKGSFLSQVEGEAAGVVDFRGGGFADAIDGSQYVGFGELRGGAAEFVPGAGVEDDETSVGVFEDVSGMEVEIVGEEEVGVFGVEGGFVGDESVATDFVEAELGGVERSLEFVTEGRGLGAGESCGCGRTEVGEDGHDVAGAGVTVQDIVDFSVDAAVDGVDHSVSLTTGWVHEEGGGEDSFSPR